MRPASVILAAILMQQPIRILITGGGAPGAAGIIKCLRQDASIHITAVDMQSATAGKLLADDYGTVPAGDDPDFIPALLSICRTKQITVVLPLVTKELLPLAKAKELFDRESISVLLSPDASLEIANNKSRLYHFLQWRDIAVPDFRVVETVEQFKTAAQELGYPQQRICFKPSESNGSRGFRILDDNMDEARMLFSAKPGHPFMRYTEAVRLLSEGPFPELLVSEYLPGEEYSVDCIANKGQTLIAVPRLREKMINGISVAGIFVQEEHIIRYCSEIIAALQLHGNIGIQVKRSAAGDFRILEINPRVQGTIAAGLGAGVNLPLLAVKQELGLPILPEELAVKWGTRFIRYWEEKFF